MRILFFHISSPIFTGGDQMVYRLVNGIDKSKYEPIVLTQMKSPLTDKLTQSGICVKIIPFRSTLDVYGGEILNYPFWKKGIVLFDLIIFNVRCLLFLYKYKIKLIWANNIRALLTIALSAKILRIPLIWNIWGKGSYRWSKFFNLLGLKLANFIITEYENQKEEIFTKRYIEKYKQKFHTIYTGHDFSSVSDHYIKREKKIKSKCKEVSIAIIGSITEKKGHIYFLEMAKEVSKKFSNLKFLVIGDIVPNNKSSIEYYNVLKNKVIKYGLENKVHFLGWRENIFDELESIDIVVSTSLSEGLPGAIREALAMGIPVVATNVGGTSEIVKDGETGILVSPKNVEQLVSAVTFLIQNPKKAREMGLKGRERVLRYFTIDNFIKSYETLFDSILNKQKKAIFIKINSCYD